MKKTISILMMTMALLLLTTAQAVGGSRVVVRQDMDLVKVFGANNTKFIIKSEIDLCGQKIVLGEGSTLAFKKGQLKNGEVVLGSNRTIKNGSFVEVTLTIGSNTTIKKCTFENRNRNICIAANSLDAKRNITIDRCRFNNCGNDIQDKGSIHCIYLNSVSYLTIKNCQFNNIGNLYTDKVSGISVNTINQEKGNGLTLENVSITNTKFNGLLSKDNNSNKHSGEYHFIIVSSTEGVSIKGNTLYNANASLGYGKEPIYLKCNNAVVEKNSIEGNYGGEAVICIKNYTKENTSSTPNVDVLDNTIRGTFFSAVYHTGSGTIKGNAIINTRAYALSCENNISENGHTIVIENNKIELGTEVPELSTGTSRAAITLLSYEDKPIRTVVKDNSIQTQSSIEVIRCRFAYDVDLELDNNVINSDGKVISFANLSGYEKSFKLRTRKGKQLKETAIQQPKSSSFKVFDVTTE